MKKLTHQFSNSELLSLILPLTLESGLNILIGMVDTMMVASCGESAVSAVALVDSISFLLITVLSAFATGGAVICSQYLGNKDGERARTTARNLIFISLVIGAILPLVVLPMRMFIIWNVFGTITDIVAGYANDYFFFLILSYPFLALYSAYTALARSEGKTKRTFYVALVMNLVNVAGNAILIFIFKLGPKGASISTLVSRVLGTAILMLFSTREKEVLSTRGILKNAPSGELIKKIVKIGVPTGIEGSFFHIGKITITAMVSTLGTSAIAINTVVNNYNAYCNISGNAICLAMITVIGQCRGNNNFEDIHYYTKKLLGILYAMSVITAIPLYIFSNQVVGLYGLEPANIVKCVPIARSCLIACCTIWPLAFCLPNTLKAVGDVKFIMISSLLSVYAVRVLGAYIFIKVLGFGVWGVWCAMYIDWIARSILYITRYKNGKWKAIKLI